MNMDSASIQFVLFGLAVALISNFSRSYIWRSAILAVSSIAFLCFLDDTPLVFLPLFGFLLFGYACLIFIERGWSRAAEWAIPVVIAIYVWLKKYTFLPEEIFLTFPFVTLGLSYIFFRVLHLLIEAKDSQTKQHVGLGAYLLYTVNFTTLVSGPIQRYEDFAKDQFTAEPIPLGARTVGMQLERIVRGFFKVNVLALLFDMVHADALSQLGQPLPASVKFYAALRLVIAYPLFLYSNFSGYIDIVIALARLTRLRLPENFDRPFSASSFIDFWNRWHITLSSWLKTYVYNPLLIFLSRRFSSPSALPLLGVISFFVTFFLVGLWHGRTSEFVFFGLLQGGGVTVNKLWQMTLTRSLGRSGYKSLAHNSIYIALGRGMTFCWFAFSLFWFWADWEQISSVYRGLSPGGWSGVWVSAWLSATVILALWEQLRTALLSIRSADGAIFTSRYARVVYASALGLCALVVTVLLSQPAPDIVYKVF
jgi:D-alanyl-lipoteichoic acid acyltransferase DltB (MBOAT superfamily)